MALHILMERVALFMPGIALDGYILIQALNRRQQLKKHYTGNMVECPICGGKQSEFAPFPNAKGQANILCLTCGSHKRHRLMWLYLRERTSIWDKNRPIRLLHFAPKSFAFHAFSKANHIDYYPVDLFPRLYRHKGKTKIRKADITQLQFEDNFFDVIICYHILEHVPNDRKGMAELHRVMKKGTGWGIFQVPIQHGLEKTFEDFSITKPGEREKAFGQWDHVRWYGSDYPDRLRSVGFEVNSDQYVKEFSKKDKERYGLPGQEILYVCRKPE